MRLLVVGEAPGRTGAWGGRTGRKMRSLLGDVSDVELTNVFRSRRPRSSKGSTFPMKSARAAASKMVLDCDLVLLVGKRVAAAFGVADARYFAPTVVRGKPGYVVPHPSGVNRWWNVELNRKRAERFFWGLSCARDADGIVDWRGFLSAVMREAAR